MKEILDKYSLTYTLNRKSGEFIIYKNISSVFLETELDLEDTSDISDFNMLSFIIKSLKIQIETDLDCIEGNCVSEYILTEDIKSVVEYTQLCFKIYNELLDYKESVLNLMAGVESDSNGKFICHDPDGGNCNEMGISQCAECKYKEMKK